MSTVAHLGDCPMGVISVTSSDPGADLRWGRPPPRGTCFSVVLIGRVPAAQPPLLVTCGCHGLTAELSVPGDSYGGQTCSLHVLLPCLGRVPRGHRLDAAALGSWHCPLAWARSDAEDMLGACLRTPALRGQGQEGWCWQHWAQVRQGGC